MDGVVSLVNEMVLLLGEMNGEIYLDDLVAFE